MGPTALKDLISGVSQDLSLCLPVAFKTHVTQFFLDVFLVFFCSRVLFPFAQVETCPLTTVKLGQQSHDAAGESFSSLLQQGVWWGQLSGS